MMAMLRDLAARRSASWSNETGTSTAGRGRDGSMKERAAGGWPVAGIHAAAEPTSPNRAMIQA
jgi:hypothetical protein